MYRCLIITLLVILTIVSACSKNELEIKSKEYSFFVAGHVYGYPGESRDNVGVHPPFKKKLNLIRNNSQIEFGVFTGDIVEDGYIENEWNELDADVAYVKKEVYFAPGNHETKLAANRVIFEDRYGESYRSFKHENDLIIILDPNLDKWSISGDQLTWLKNLLNSEENQEGNIFVFFHQLLWWEENSILENYPPNSLSGRGENINFRTEVYPLFRKTNRPTFMFAGDTGVYESGFMYYKDSNNITFIASGMGGRKQDNFIVVNVSSDKSVDFQLVALNGSDINALGKLEDYQMPQSK